MLAGGVPRGNCQKRVVPSSGGEYDCAIVLTRYYIEFMKRRSIEPADSRRPAEEALCRALLSLKDVSTMRAFLHDLCTPAELEALTDRWKVVPYILEGMPYREIHEVTAVSITTIGRVARFLNEGNGGYLKAARATARAAAGKKKTAS